MADAKRFVGIDVAKAQLEVAIGPNGESFSVANDETGISELLRRLEPADLGDYRSDRRPGSPRCQCPGDGGDRGCSGQPTPGARLRSRHRTAGQDRRARRASAGAIWRSGQTPGESAARRAGPGARSPREPPPATG